MFSVAGIQCSHCKYNKRNDPHVLAVEVEHTQMDS